MAETLRRLNLKKPNHCVVLPETEAYLGMLRKVKDYVAYGNLTLETLKMLLKHKGEVRGLGKLNENNVKLFGFDSVEELAEALYKGETSFKDIPRLKPVFRLRPPSRGYKSVKKPYPKGALGNWGSDIDSLIRRML